jgi:tetratricopeptide (TPR) repeat protein
MPEVCLALSRTGAREEVCTLKRVGRTDGSERDRFRLEGEVARRLDHRAIARTLAFGDVDGELYLAQEFVHGVDLANLNKNDVPVPIAVHIACEVAQALAYLHGFENLGLLHGEVTPANVHLSFAGKVKLVDFATAAPPYVAPEVLRGVKGDRRSDAYSLGVLLWELLARRKFLDEWGPPSRFNSEIPPALDALVARAAAELPEQRFQTDEALVEALASALSALSAGFDGPGALRALLAERYEVELQTRAIEGQLDRARQLWREPAAPDAALQEVRSVDATTERNRQDRPRRRRIPPRQFIIWLALGAFAGLVLTTSVLILGSTRRSAAPAAAPLPPPRPARAVLAPAPPPQPLPAEEPPPPPARPARARVVREPPEEIPAAAPPAAPPAAAIVATPDAAVAEPTPERLMREAEARFHTRDLAGAERAARRAAEAKAPRAFYLLGLALFAEKKFSEAEEAFAESVRLEPGNQDATRHLELAREAARGRR